MRDSFLFNALATSFLAGEPNVAQLVSRATRTLGRPWRWLRPLARRYAGTFAGKTRPRQREVARFLLRDAGFARARAKYSHEISVVEWLAVPSQMQPVPAVSGWDLPAIVSVRELADWLRVDVTDLEWFADLKALGYKSSQPKLRHYQYQILTKRSGGLRLVEAPKAHLKGLQRQILKRILEKVPPHPAVHGFVKGRSIKTFVQPHARKQVVLRMDLHDFFPSFAGARVQAFFRTLGYPERVADLLGGICTNATPRDVWSGLPAGTDQLREARALYSRPHLPQGAPTSPLLANSCAYRVDCRLAGLAKSAGADYTRYADDLVFSGGTELERRIGRFSTHVAAILMEEGFRVNHHKTRVMRRGVRQHLAGLVANEHPNVARPDYDRLKAILTNCIRFGPESQNREGHPCFREHIEGRVGFVEMVNPVKGKRLRGILERILWE